VAARCRRSWILVLVAGLAGLVLYRAMWLIPGARRVGLDRTPNSTGALPALAPRPDHPLAPALQRARESYAHIDRAIKDYTATLVKHERVGDELVEPETMFTKIRHEQLQNGRVVTPFSVYLRFEGPERIKDREVLYVAGHNDGKLLVRENPRSLTGKLMSTTSLNPAGMFAMRGNRYPITEVGIKNLIQRLIDVAEEEMRYDECEVTIDPSAQLDGRKCQCIQVIHPVRRSYFRFHLARIYVDDQQNVPISYESYDWPQVEGQQPPLIEKYTYHKLQLNVGLTDRDFDPANPEYHFQ